MDGKYPTTFPKVQTTINLIINNISLVPSNATWKEGRPEVWNRWSFHKQLNERVAKIDSHFVREGIHSMARWWQKCIDHQGDYVEKKNTERSFPVFSNNLQ